MRRFTWLVSAFFFCGAALAQNNGIDHRFGDGGIASIEDPQDANAGMYGFVSCAISNERLRVVAAINATQLGTLLLNADGRHVGTLTRINVPAAAQGAAAQAIGACTSDGRIVIARAVEGAGSDQNIQVLRLRNDGSLDPSFGTNGSVLIDMDTHSSVITDTEMPMGINLEADGGVLLSLGLGVIGSVYDAGLVRLGSNGLLRFARHYATLPGMTNGGTTLYASAAGVAADGRVWMAGTATLPGFTRAFRVRLDGTTGMVVDAPVYGGGDSVITGGGRVLADGSTMVLAARSTADGLRYLPRLVVIRGNQISYLTLPEPFAIAGAPASMPSVLSRGTVIPTGEGRLLVVDALARATDTSLRLATYLSVVHLGADAAGDQVDTHFGVAGRTQFAWRGAQICENDAPPMQQPAHATNWRGRALVTGWHSRTCSTGPIRAMLVRVQNAGDVFADDFE